MVDVALLDFNACKCRNCEHWHVSWSIEGYGRFTFGSCQFNLGTVRGKEKEWKNRYCSCNNWESVDNLTYLEQRYEKRSLNV